MSHYRTTLVLSLLAALALLAAEGCTHTYALRMQGRAVPGSKVQASCWSQGADGKAPLQQAGRSTVADEEGRFVVESVTVLDFAGPPSHLVLEVSGLGPTPLCVIVPTRGLWKDEILHTIELPPLRSLAPEETTYELPAPGLPDSLKVVRKDPDKERCITPGG